MTRGSHARSGLLLSGLVFAATNTASGQQPAGESGALDEIVVTARRVEENLQTVPISITALSQKELETQNIQQYSDLQHTVPGLSESNGPSGRDESFSSIRGASGCATDCTAVVSYLNEIPLPEGPAGGTGGGGPGLFYDLANVQVLKGPQGTLFGRNTMAGAILFQTRRPYNDFGGYLQATGGNYNNRDFDGALNVPLIHDQLLLRAAFTGQDRDGFTRSLGTPSHPQGWDLDSRHFFSWRGTLLYKPNEAIENTFIFEHVLLSNHGTSLILNAVDPQGVSATLFPQLSQILAQQQALGPRTQVPVDTDPANRAYYHAATDILKVNLGHDLTFRNIAGYSTYQSNGGNDADGTALPLFNVTALSGIYTVKQLTEEVQLLGRSLGGRLNWVTGAFYMDHPAQDMEYDLTTVLGASTASASRSWGSSRAIYGQGTYDLSAWVSGLKFTGGARYTWDRKATLTQNLDADTTCGGSADRSACTLNPTGSFRAPSWTLGLDYQLQPDVLLYLASRRGFHAGGFNALAPADDTADQRYQAEYVTDEELGVKADWHWLDVQGRSNVALYRENYTDIQTAVVTPLPNSPGNTFVKNAGEAEIMGAEVEQAFVLSKRLQLNLMFGWLDFRYTHVAEGVDLNQLNFQIPSYGPRIKYGVSGQYTLLKRPGIGNVSVGASWNWQSRSGILIAQPGDPAAYVQPYGLVGVNADWNDVMGWPLDAAFFMTNVANQTHVEGGLGLYPALGFDNLVYGDPRIWGIRLKYRFGAEN